VTPSFRAASESSLSECSSTVATDFPQHFEAAVKFLSIVRIERKAKPKRGNENSHERKYEAMRKARAMALDKVPGDEPARAVPRRCSRSAPQCRCPSARSITKLPDGISLEDAQALLAQKLDEARAIMGELSRSTGSRFTLTRNFQIVLDLNGR
jgi:hypothetical protein